MINFLRAILYLVFAAAIAWLATSNVEEITFTYSPTHTPLEIPAYILGLGGIGVGFVFGCFIVWINSFGQYLTVKKQKKEIKKLSAKIEKLDKENQERQKAEMLAQMPPKPYSDNGRYSWDDEE